MRRAGVLRAGAATPPVFGGNVVALRKYAAGFQGPPDMRQLERAALFIALKALNNFRWFPRSALGTPPRQVGWYPVRAVPLRATLSQPLRYCICTISM